MKIEHVATPHAPQPIGPYSQAVQFGAELYCSGQIPLDPRTGEVVGEERRRKPNARWRTSAQSSARPAITTPTS